MKTDEWGESIDINVPPLGDCKAYRRIVRGEYYQWKIKYYCEEVIGDYCYDNIKAFDNALAALKKRFNNIFSND